jgi:hypothetical protein
LPAISAVLSRRIEPRRGLCIRPLCRNGCGMWRPHLSGLQRQPSKPAHRVDQAATACEPAHHGNTALPCPHARSLLHAPQGQGLAPVAAHRPGGGDPLVCLVAVPGDADPSVAGESRPAAHRRQ